MSKLDDILDTPEKKENWKKMLDDRDLDNSPCVNCKKMVYWAFRYCHYCGVQNESFDEQYELELADDEGNLHHRHEEMKDPELKASIFCNYCGVQTQ